jgi:hypothetical protein
MQVLTYYRLFSLCAFLADESLGGGERRQLPNKDQDQTKDRERSSSLGVGGGANILSLYRTSMLQSVVQGLGYGQIHWNTLITGTMEMRFGTWNITSL